ALLTQTSQATATATATITPTATSPATATALAIAATEASVLATAQITATADALLTQTSQATATATATITPTAETPATATALAIAATDASVLATAQTTATADALLTQTSQATATATATITPTATSPATATSTAIAATEASVLATAQITAAPTLAIEPTEPAPPIASPTQSRLELPVEIASPTQPAPMVIEGAVADLPGPRALPRLDAVLLPTPTLHGTPQPGLPDACRVRADWLPYQVKPGDTLFALAEQSGTSLVALRDGNCFSYVRGALPGERILLPSPPDLPAPSATSSATEQEDDVRGCASRSAAFMQFAPMSELADIVAIRGSAAVPAGGRYRLLIRPGGSLDYALYYESAAAKQDEVLALLNIEIFGSGLHSLRLEVLDAEGVQINAGFCEIPLLFQPPIPPAR
ncbi:MAG: LysM peptidoglycan-binding domain-containing protein, partial [Chloroflexi bacterium]|nr:LysM peptidoglycan-binding domain-containing protein [Chloroflexota bacterium]